MALTLHTGDALGARASTELGCVCRSNRGSRRNASHERNEDGETRCGREDKARWRGW